MAMTIFVISYTYTKIIEHFPQGGGGYLVATELLGSTPGVVSGCALLVDYVLTITVSIASGGDAVFSLLPAGLHQLKMPVEFAAIILLIVLNLRGVKESVTPLIPVFLAFVVTHAVLILGAIILHFSDFPAITRDVRSGIHEGSAAIGAFGLFAIFLRAFSLGGGTYTGIEAVSNAVAALREPKVETGKRTMLYMATSLAGTAGGLLLCYMLLNLHPVEGKTLNAVFAEQFAGGFRPAGIPVGYGFVMITVFSEALLLLIAAQTGFIDGPRVMANMAIDSWLPRRFSALSDRLTMQNGILLIGGAAVALLIYTRGKVELLVVMYSINVFLTFTLSQTGMIRLWIQKRATEPNWKRNLFVHLIGFGLCFSILLVMVREKLTEGAWVTMLITSACIALCFLIRRHYRNVVASLIEFKQSLADLPAMIEQDAKPQAILPSTGPKQTAVLLVGGYDGLGIHLLLNVLRLFPQTFDRLVFLSVGVIDSAFFRQEKHVEAVETRTRESLARYENLARKLGFEADSVFRIGTDVAEEASELCLELGKKYPHCIFFAGELLFDKPVWYHRVLHNETAYAIQRHIRFAGLSMMILPLLLHNAKGAQSSTPVAKVA